MRSLNKIFLMGALGADPEVREKVTYANLATSEKFLNRSSQNYETKTEWHKLVLFGTQANFAQKYLHKGSKVFVEGTLRTRKWEDKDGNKHSRTEIVVKDIQSLDWKNEDAEPAEEDIWEGLRG